MFRVFRFWPVVCGNMNTGKGLAHARKIAQIHSKDESTPRQGRALRIQSIDTLWDGIACGGLRAQDVDGC